MKKDFSNKAIILTDLLTGQIIEVIDVNTYSSPTIAQMIFDNIIEDIFGDEHGISVTLGIKP